MSESRTARRVLMETLRDLADSLHNGRWKVRRGATNWAVWPFADHPWGCAIIAAETTLGSEQSATISLDMFTAIPGDELRDRGIDDGVLEEILCDVETLFRQLHEAVDGRGDAVTLTGIKIHRAAAVEAHDPNIGAQGVIVTFEVDF